MSKVESVTEQGNRVFISYAHANRAVARRIADALRGAGLHVRVSEWELQSGDSLLARIDEAVSGTDYLVVLLSPESVTSTWVQSELSAAASKELKARAIPIVPVLIADCEIPQSIADRPHIDLRQDLEAGIQRLIEMLRSIPKIDFSRLDSLTFENLIADVFTDRGFLVNRSPPNRDQRFDFVAVLPARDPLGGRRDEHWLVEVKHYRDQRVGVSTLQNILGEMLSRAATEKCVVVTSGQLTSIAREFLMEMAAKSRTEIRVIDGADLKQLLLRQPELVQRYFSERF